MGRSKSRGVARNAPPRCLPLPSGPPATPHGYQEQGPLIAFGLRAQSPPLSGAIQVLASHWVHHANARHLAARSVCQCPHDREARQIKTVTAIEVPSAALCCGKVPVRHPGSEQSRFG
jgi:hypothetical protein